MPKEFKGKISLDVRDSVADWTPFTADNAPDGAPNVLVVLYDDTGLAAWSPFGGRINMPTLQRLADNGLMYSQWHTTALCSPTRSMFLTGRNHHQNGFARSPRARPDSPATTRTSRWRTARSAEVLRESGYNTFWVGKNHNVPVDEWTMGASKRNWPLAPRLRPLLRLHRRRDEQLVSDLVEDNHYVDQPYLPEDGYHLSKDLADKALEMHPRLEQSAARQAVVSCGSARARTTHRTTRRRSTSTSTRASSTTATRPTASGCCRG